MRTSVNKYRQASIYISTSISGQDNLRTGLLGQFREVPSIVLKYLLYSEDE